MTYETIPNAPTAGSSATKNRRLWAAVTKRGVFIGDPSRVHVYPPELLPRVVVRGDAEVHEHRDVLVMGPFGDRNDYLTVTFKPALMVTTGCFTFPLEQFRAEVAQKEPGPRRSEYEAAIALIEAVAAVRCPA